MRTPAQSRLAGTALSLAMASCAVLACGSDVPATRWEYGSTVCSAAVAPLRWVSGDSRYRLEGTFSEEADEFLSGVQGLAWTGQEELAAYDSRLGRLLFFSPDLAHVRSAGALGDGPGEFAGFPSKNRRILDRNWLSVVGDSLLVFDARRMAWFDEAGSFGRSRQGFPAGFRGAVGVVWLTGARGRAFFGFDDALDPGRRSMQLWAEGEDAAELAWEVDAIALPTMARGGVFSGPQQSRMLVGSAGDCVYILDSSSTTVYRMEASTARWDTLYLDHLPSFDTPSVRAVEITPEMAAMGAAVDVPPPSAISRWRGLQVDPDGVLWLLPARTEEAERLEGPVTVVTVRPGDGGVHVIEVPRFPAAFGRAGEFYALAQNEITRVPELMWYRAR